MRKLKQSRAVILSAVLMLSLTGCQSMITEPEICVVEKPQISVQDHVNETAVITHEDLGALLGYISDLEFCLGQSP